MSKTIIALVLVLSFGAVSTPVRAHDQFSDETNVSAEESGENFLLEEEAFDTDWGSKHLGCVNSSSSCRNRAYQHGYSHYRIQQDFYCPKTIYSCYAW